MTDPHIIYGLVGHDPPTARLYYGLDVRESLRLLPDESVQVVCTSPPYWGLRSYLDEDCDDKAKEIGTEATPQEYAASMVAVFREIRRVLRPDGVAWLNLGDSYVHGPSPGYKDVQKSGLYGIDSPSYRARLQGGAGTSRATFAPGLKPKDLCLVPHRVAIALQEDGWWLRQDIVWAKNSVMPEPVTDRCTRSHEYVFLLTKSRQYYYDAEAIREGEGVTVRKGTKGGIQLAQQDGYKGLAGGTLKRDPDEPYGFARDIVTQGHNRRSVWTVNPIPYPGAHFAVWPPKLVEPMILAGSSPQSCPHCGAPWKRILKRHGETTGRRKKYGTTQLAAEQGITNDSRAWNAGSVPTSHHETLGWEPTCDCDDNDGSGRCVVMDPFSGSGTTGMVAFKHGRDYVGLDLNGEYLPLAEARITGRAAPEEDDGDNLIGDLFG